MNDVVRGAMVSVGFFVVLLVCLSVPVLARQTILENRITTGVVGAGNVSSVGVGYGINNTGSATSPVLVIDNSTVCTTSNTLCPRGGSFDFWRLGADVGSTVNVTNNTLITVTGAGGLSSTLVANVLTVSLDNLGSFSTSDLSEGSNLYFTSARAFDSVNGTNLSLENLDVGENITAKNITFDEWHSRDGAVLTLSDGGGDAFLKSNVGGVNKFTIDTDGAFFSLIANPGPANGFLLATLTETQGSDTELNFYEGGTGHNRFWNSGSARFGGDEGYLCSTLTDMVDCDTPTSGADVVVQDEIWTGGRIITGNGTLNTTDAGDLLALGYVNASTDVCVGSTCLSESLTSESDPLWSGNASRVTTLESQMASLPNLSVSDVAAIAPNNTVSGAYDYITLSGQNIVRGQVDLSTDVTGTLPSGNIQDAYLLNTGDTATGTYSFTQSTDANAYSFTQTDSLTGQHDVFEIVDQDTGGGGQDESSALHVYKSSTFNIDDDGSSVLALTLAGPTNDDSIGYVYGRNTDRGTIQWGVDSNNEIWTSGDLSVGATGTDCGGTGTSCHSGGKFIVNVTGSSIQLTDSDVVVNENAASNDFRIETADSQNAFHVDGGLNRIGFGVAANDFNGIDMSPMVTRSGFVRGIQLAPFVESANNGMIGIGGNPRLRPTTNLGTVYGSLIIGTMDATASGDSYNSTNAIGGFYRVDTSTTYTGTIDNAIHAYIANGVVSNSSASVLSRTGIQVVSLSADNTVIGIRSQQSAGTNKWNLYIDGTADNYLQGDTGIGTSTPGVQLELEDNSISTAQLRVDNSAGQCDGTASAGSFTWSCSSDERLKPGIKVVNKSAVVDKLVALSSCMREYQILETFEYDTRVYDENGTLVSGSHWYEYNTTVEEKVGYSAQCVQLIHPELVSTHNFTGYLWNETSQEAYFVEDEPTLSVEMPSVNELLVGVRELTGRTVSLQGEVDVLKSRGLAFEQSYCLRFPADEVCV